MHLFSLELQHVVNALFFPPEVYNALCMRRGGCLDLSADVFKTQEVFFLSLCHLSKEEAGTPEVKIA